MGRGFRKGVGGGNAKPNYTYEIYLWTWACRVKKYYKGKLVLDTSSVPVQSWNTYVWKDDIIGVYGYQQNTTYLTVNLQRPAEVNGVKNPSGVIYTYNYGSASSWPTITLNYEINAEPIEKIWLYKTGDEYTDITGGWGSVAPLQSQMTKEASALKFVFGGSGNTNQRVWGITNDKIDISKAWRVGMKIDGRDLYYGCEHLNGEYYIVAGAWVQGWSTVHGIRGCATSKTDSAVFSSFPYSTYSEITNSGSFRVTEVWLEKVK